MADHPITPPHELVEQWDSEAVAAKMPGQLYLATQAARWGADQELSACCKLLDEEPHDGPMLHAVRRPKPPSLKKQAYNALDTYIYGTPDHKDKQRTYNIIRRALEQLND